MTNINHIEERLAAIERTVIDGDHDLPDLTDISSLRDDLEQFDSRLTELERRVAEVEAATQATDGYVSNIQTVNKDIERQADAAIAAVDRFERQLEQFEERLDELADQGTVATEGDDSEVATEVAAAGDETFEESTGVFSGKTAEGASIDNGSNDSDEGGSTAAAEQGTVATAGDDSEVATEVAAGDETFEESTSVSGGETAEGASIDNGSNDSNSDSDEGGSTYRTVGLYPPSLDGSNSDSGEGGSTAAADRDTLATAGDDSEVATEVAADGDNIVEESTGVFSDEATEGASIDKGSNDSDEGGSTAAADRDTVADVSEFATEVAVDGDDIFEESTGVFSGEATEGISIDNGSNGSNSDSDEGGSTVAADQETAEAEISEAATDEDDEETGFMESLRKKF